MGDQDLAITGSDTSLKVLVDGELKKVSDQITNFTVRPVYDETQVKPLGQDGSNIDKTFTHYEGELTFAASTTDIDDIQDLVNAALKTRTPVRIVIVESTRFRNVDRRTYAYPDCKLEFDRRAQRGQAQETTVSFKCGVHRTRL